MSSMMRADKKYLLTFLASCMFILSIGLGNTYSIFVVPMAELLNVGRGTVTLASTITDLICGFLSPVLVMLLKRLKLRTLLLWSTVIYSITLFITGLFPNIYIYYLMHILKGFLFIVYGTNIIVITLGNWFEKGRDTLTGIAIACTSVGGAIFTQVFQWILDNKGVPMTFIAYGVLTTLFALPAIYYLKFTPEEKGLTVLKEDSIKEDKKSVSHERPFSFSDPVFIGVCVVFFIMTFLTNVSMHFPGYVATIGIAHAGAPMVSAMMLGGMIMKAAMGFICDKYGPKVGYPISILIVLISLVLIVVARSESILVFGSFLFGGVFGNLIALNPLIRYCFGDKQYPEVFAKIMMVSALSNMGGPIVGYLYDFTGTYTTSLYAAVIMCAMALIIYYVTISVADKTVN